MDHDLWLRMPEVLAFYCRYHRGDLHIPRWPQVFDGIAVRRDFARHHPESACRLLRRAFRKSDWKAGDLKHRVANLLPAPLYEIFWISLHGGAGRASKGRFLPHSAVDEANNAQTPIFQ